MATTLKAAGYYFPAKITPTKETTMRKFAITLVAVFAAMLFLATGPASAATPTATSASSGSVLPIYKTKLTSTAKLRSAMKARPEIAQDWVNKTGGGEVDRGEWHLCGVVTKSDRRTLERAGYKNTGYTLDGRKVRLSKLKPGAMRWACRVDVEQVEKDLKAKVGPKAKCTKKVYKSGTVTVICSQGSKTLRVTPPKKAKKIAVGFDCTNAQEKGDGEVAAGDTLRGVWTAWEVEKVKKGETIVCPGGASATAIAEAYAKGFGYGRTRKAAVKMARANAKASVKVSGSCDVPVVVKPIPMPPPPQPAPPVQPPAMAHAIATATASATATAECPDGTTASASGSGYGYGEGWSTVSYQDALKKAQAAAQADAEAKASANAVATVKCGTTPPPPPPPGAPELVSVTVINDVYVGMTSPNFCATVSMPGTNTGTLIMSSKYGSFKDPTSSGTIAGGTVRFTVSGNDRVCATYVAPSEGVPGGNETITVTLRDNVTGQSAAANVQSFPLKILPPNPDSADAYAGKYL